MADAPPRFDQPPPAEDEAPTVGRNAPADTPTEGSPPEPAPTEPPGPDFDVPFPEEACATTSVVLSHRSHPVPRALGHAVALRSDDGRFVRVLMGPSPLAQDSRGRFVPPTEGDARFEFEAIRRRRGPLEPGPLGPPDSRRTALSHVRIVTPGPILTFGHRNIGRVELTHVDAERVCGRVDLNDGFGRVRGPFSAAVVGPPPP